MQYKLIRENHEVGEDTYQSYRAELSDPTFARVYADLYHCSHENPVVLSDGRRMRVQSHSQFWARVGKIVHYVVEWDEAAGKPLPADTWMPLVFQVGTFDEPRSSTPDETAAIVAAMIQIHGEVLAKFAAATHPLHHCAGHRDGCPAMVSVPGDYCPRCRHGED